MSELVEKVNLAVIKIWQNEGGNYTDAPAGTRLDTSAVTRAAIAAVAEWLEKSGSMQGAIVGNALLEQLEQPK